MITEAFSSIQAALVRAFPDSKILLNWPEPRQKISYPHLVIINVRQEQVHWPEKFLEEITNPDSSKTTIFQIGEWRCRIDLNYFAKNPKDMNNFIAKMTDFFQTDSSNALANRSLNLDFGTRPYEVLNFTWLDYSLSQQAYPLQAGSGRSVIFRCMANFPDLARNTVPIMTDIKLDEDKSVVSESAKV